MSTQIPVLIFMSLILLNATAAVAFQKGIALGLYSKDSSYSYEQELKEIRATGADHVSLIFSWYQKNISSNEIYPHWKSLGDFDTPSDERLSSVIRQAHKEGLKVFLFPILRIEERKDKEWRGSVIPSDRDRWLKGYRKFTLHYARMAASYGVELFSVGSELCSVEDEIAFWKKLIANVRGFYRGELLYSANWDHYKKIGFWDQLDYLGLNGYYELSQNGTPTLPELTRKWWDIENELTEWHQEHKKPLIFTEIGYPSIDGACQKPWDYTRETPIDLEEQALCYQAFFFSWNENPRLGGVYFWNWYGQGGANDRSYTPKGKPAEKILTQWYQNRPPKPTESSALSITLPGKLPDEMSGGTSVVSRAPSSQFRSSSPVHNRLTKSALRPPPS